MATQVIQPSARLTSRNGSPHVVCWEAVHPRRKTLRQARRLYKASLPSDERIPWRWIKTALAGGEDWRPERWNCHLLLAGLSTDDPPRRRVVGFAYGAHVPGFGGYGGYLAVSDRHRGRGIGTRLWRLLIQRLQLDAACAGVALPFVIWESRPPAPDASPQECAQWDGRMRVWKRVGAWQVGGVEFLTPNYANEEGPPVPLRLFLTPVDVPARALDAPALRQVAAGLHRHVYHMPDDDPLVNATLPLGSRPFLEPLSADS